MRQIRPDLHETTAQHPFEGLTTHAYLWTPPSSRNVLLYSTVTDQDHDEIERLGGVDRQYLSHRDEAGPMLAAVAERFGADLHVSAREEADAARFQVPARTWAARLTDPDGIEVIPTPGHTPGSTCFLVPGADGATYLFTGDTIFVGTDGRWHAGMLPFSDRDDLTAALELLAGLEPDLVVSSAAPDGEGAHVPDRPWSECVAEAMAGLHQPA
jgi:hydroxyacylglutathione hydrolase